MWKYCDKWGGEELLERDLICSILILEGEFNVCIGDRTKCNLEITLKVSQVENLVSM